MTRLLAVLLATALVSLPATRADCVEDKCPDSKGTLDALTAGFLVCMGNEAKVAKMQACPEGDKGCAMKICFPECPSDEFQDLLDCGHDECPDDEADLIETAANLNCEDPSRFRSWWIVGVVVAVLVIGGGVAAFLLTRGGGDKDKDSG